MNENIDPLDGWAARIPPDLNGHRARAWHWPPPKHGVPPHATLTSWILYAPHAHPFWSWHAMSVVTLREVPGVPAATKRYPGAEHELLVLALHPDEPVPSPRSVPEPGELHFLEPPDAVVQFDGLTDAQAIDLAALCAREVCDGALVPDSDHRGAWDRRVTTAINLLAGS